ILRDREGSIWVGTSGGGLARWVGFDRWHAWTRDEGLRNSDVRAMAQESSGTWWAGTNRGLYQLKPGERTWTEYPLLRDRRIFALAAGSDGMIWAGCAPGGVARLDTRGGTVRVYQEGSGLAANNVVAIAVDGEGRVWASTDAGLFRSSSAGSATRFERMSPPSFRATACFSKCC